MPHQPQSQANSLLNLLNPYQQSTRDIRHSHSHLPHPDEGDDEIEPESPSAMLLRELQGEGEGGESSEDEKERERYRIEEREGMSPTPTPSRSIIGLGLASITNPKVGAGNRATTTTTSSSEDDDQPPQSIMYANDKPAGRTNNRRREEDSPGPFRPAGSSSTISASASASVSRSASTSPGPSTISNYASGLDLGNTVEPSIPVSPDSVKHIPTFREPPGSSRIPSGSSSRQTVEEGYLDPPLSSSRRTGKAKGNQITRPPQSVPYGTSVRACYRSFGRTYENKTFVIAKLLI